MSIAEWIITIVGAAVGTTLFEIVFHWLFDSKRQMPKHLDPAYQSRIRWWEYVQRGSKMAKAQIK